MAPFATLIANYFTICSALTFTIIIVLFTIIIIAITTVVVTSDIFIIIVIPLKITFIIKVCTILIANLISAFDFMAVLHYMTKFMTRMTL